MIMAIIIMILRCFDDDLAKCYRRTEPQTDIVTTKACYSQAKNLQIFLQPYFATLSYKSLQKFYPQVLYLFGNLS